MRTLATIPHHPNPLGVGMLGHWQGEDARPRPGVVRVNGLSESLDEGNAAAIPQKVRLTKP